MKDDSSIRSWDRIADDWARHVDTNDYYNVFLTPATLERLGDVSGKRILDLGCGEGGYCRVLKKRGADVTGIDGSEKLINIAKAHSDSSIKFFVRNANDLDGIKENSFEIVVAAMSLMNVEDYEGSVSEVRRVLNEDGYLLMSILHPCFSDHFTNRQAYFDQHVWHEHITPEFSHPVLQTHKPLSDFINPLVDLGFRLKHFLEPVPTDEQIQAAPRLKKLCQIPLFLFMEWKNQ